MSVIVKGMEMPENCFECPCCRHDSVDGIKAEQCNLTLDVFDANYFERWNSRAQNCPLIELPPHGRLIDIRSVEDGKFVTVGNDYQRWWNGALESVIDNAPTVIEGSET